MSLQTRVILVAAALSAPFVAGNAVATETGFYLGGSVGSANIEVNLGDDIQLPGSPPDLTFDEDDFAWKIFGGFNWEVLVLDLGVEGSYVNFGKPSTTVLDQTLEFEASGFDVFGVAGFNLGPLGVFGKLGYIFWDADGRFGSLTDSESGEDVAYGLGVRFNLWNLEFRGEYELFDIEEAEDIAMWSLGASWYFN